MTLLIEKKNCRKKEINHANHFFRSSQNASQIE